MLSITGFLTATAHPQNINLQSNEGTNFSISKDAAFLSHMIADIYGDFPEEEGTVFTLPLSKMNDTILASAIKYLNLALTEYRKEIPGFNPVIIEERKEHQQKIITILSEAIHNEIEQAQEPIEQIVDLIKIVNHLDVPELMEAACNEASKRISWENSKNEHWGILPIEMISKIVSFIGQNNRDALFLLIPSATSTLKRHISNVHHAEFSPDGTKIVTQSLGPPPAYAHPQSVKIWDVEMKRLMHSFKVSVMSLTPKFSPDGTKIAIASRRGFAVEIRNTQTGERIHTLQDHTEYIYTAHFSPDGTKIATASRDMTAKIWDTQTGELIHTLSGHTDEVRAAQFSPDGTKIVTISKDTTAKIWNTRTGIPFRTLEGHEGSITSVLFSPDGTKIITTSMDNTVKIWNARTGRMIRSHENYTEHVRSAKFSPDGTKIVTTADDFKIRMLDAETGQLNYVIEKQSTVQFNASGTKIVTIPSDGDHPKIWDAQTGQLLISLEEHNPPLERNPKANSAQFSPDGTKVVTSSWDRTAKIWDISLPWIKDYIEGRMHLEQALLIITLNAQYTEGQPTYFNKIIGPNIPTNRLKQIFKTFNKNMRKSLTKRFNIQEEPAIEIFEEGREQLGL